MDWLVVIRNAERRLERGDIHALRALAAATIVAMNELARIAADPRWRKAS